MIDNENTFAIEVLEIYLAGSYVYSLYRKQTGGIDITGDYDKFYMVLGWMIKHVYPEGFGHIIDTLDSLPWTSDKTNFKQ